MPVEIRLLFTQVFSILLFGLMRYATKWLGEGFSGMLEEQIYQFFMGNPNTQSININNTTINNTHQTIVPPPPVEENSGTNIPNLVTGLANMFSSTSRNQSNQQKKVASSNNKDLKTPFYPE